MLYVVEMSGDGQGQSELPVDAEADDDDESTALTQVNSVLPQIVINLESWTFWVYDLISQNQDRDQSSRVIFYREAV